MGSYEPDADPERFFSVFLNQLYSFGRGVSVGMHEVISIRLDYHERVAAHDRFLAVRITLQRLPVTRRSPFRALAIEALCPGESIVGAVASLLDATGDAHVKHLADAGSVVPPLLEVLRPGGAVADPGSWIGIP
jgi:hypothetical protein